MNDFDLERLGELWREDPTPAEVERMRQTAAEVSLRARRAQFIEAGAAILVSALVLTLIIVSGRLDTAVIGGATIVLLLTSHMRQRRLRAVELKALSGTTEEMLDQSIARAEATLKRNRFSLIGMAPATLVGSLLASLAGDWRGRSPLPFSATGPLVVGLLLLLLALVALHLVRAIRRDREEIKRLQILRESYRKEDRVTDRP